MSDFHQPTSWIMSASTRAQRSTMAPLDRRDRASTSCGRRPWARPCDTTKWQRKAVMARVVRVCGVLRGGVEVKYVLIGVSAGA